MKPFRENQDVSRVKDWKGETGRKWKTRCTRTVRRMSAYGPSKAVSSSTNGFLASERLHGHQYDDDDHQQEWHFIQHAQLPGRHAIAAAVHFVAETDKIAVHPQ